MELLWTFSVQTIHILLPLFLLIALINRKIPSFELIGWYVCRDEPEHLLFGHNEGSCSIYNIE